MDLSFRRLRGDSRLGVDFFWSFSAKARPGEGTTASERLIPDLFFDYLYVKKGAIRATGGRGSWLPSQCLKTIFTRPVTLEYTTPLVLYGARLALRFAESFWGAMTANTFLSQAWAEKEPRSLGGFAHQVVDHIRRNRGERWAYPMFSCRMEESGWLAVLSPRQKRRVYATVFGMSRRALLSIYGVQSFLKQGCDFAAGSPRILDHVDPEVFYDQPHLNRSFKKMTGLTPVEFFQASSPLQNNLMSASSNEVSER